MSIHTVLDAGARTQGVLRRAQTPCRRCRALILYTAGLEYGPSKTGRKIQKLSTAIFLCKYLGNFHNFCTFSYFIQHKNYEYIDYKLLVTLWWERQLFLNKYKLLILIYHSSIFYISSCRLICTSAYAEIADIMFNRTVPFKPNENQLRKNIKKQTHIPWCHYIIAEVAA